MQARVHDLLNDLGYKVEVDDFKLIFSDPHTAFPEPKTVLCGRVQDVDPREFADSSLDMVVVEDGATPRALARVTEAATGEGVACPIENESRFVDRLWQASLLLGAIEDDAHAVAMQIPAEAEDIDLSVEAWYQRHFDRQLTTNDTTTVAALYFDDWLEEPDPSVPIVYAEAGTGKTELAAYIAERSAKLYRARVQAESFDALPTLVFRVPLDVLPGPSLGALARYLDDGISLVRITSGALYHLLVGRRIALVLDGLDEVDVPFEKMRQALREVATLVKRGAKIAITSRSIAALGVDTDVIKGGLDGLARRVEFVGLNREQAAQFLESYDVEPAEAARTVALLPDTFAANPLFLLLGWAAEVAKAFDEQIAAARRTQLMDLLVQKFCEREHRRQGIEVETQLFYLTYIAFEASLRRRALMRETVLEVLDGRERRLVTYPHGLLMIRTNPSGEEEVWFRSDLVRRLLIAQQLCEDLHDAIMDGTKAVTGYLEGSFHLSRKALTSQTLEALAELMSENDIKTICRAVAEHQLRRERYLARNLLFIALYFLERFELGHSKDRANRLANLLSTTDLSGTSLAGLVFDNLDFSGWDLTRTTARGAKFVGCLLADAKMDASSLVGAQFQSCDTAPTDPSDRKRIATGLDLLLTVVERFRVGDSDVVLRRVSARALEADVMAILGDYGHAVRHPGPDGGTWALSGRGERAFTRLIANPAPHPDLEPLLRDIGSL